MEAKRIMSKKFQVEIDSCIVAELHDALNKYYSYDYRGTDEELMKCFIDSVETITGHELVKILLGNCQPEELL